MIFRQIGAAKQAPVMAVHDLPCIETLNIGLVGCVGLPTQTAVVSPGVYPTNHDCELLFEVPVLPADTRPGSWLSWPEPCVMLYSRYVVAWETADGSATCWHDGFGAQTALPPALTSVTG